MRRLAAVIAMTIASSWYVAGPVRAGVVCDHTVEIVDFSFTPASVTKGAQDDLIVCWHNNGPSMHTATSDSAMFDTGSIFSGNIASARLYGSGAYPYHCSIHPGMTATLKVKPVTGTSMITLGQTLKLTVGDQCLLKGVSWDVQRKRDDGAWVTIKTGTTDAMFPVKPARAGTFRYRARTHFAGHASGWSPARIVTVNPA